MINKLIGIGLTLAILASAGPARAQELRWKRWTSQDWRFSMEIPAGTRWKAAAYGRWGGFVGSFADTTAAVLGYRGPVTRKAVRAFAVRYSKIPARFWKPINRGKNWHGFKWYESYRFSFRGMTVVGAMLRHSDGLHTYVVFVRAPTRTFLRQGAAFKRFADSFQALGAVPVPRGWKRWTSAAWKISMLIPSRTRWTAAAWGRWGGFVGRVGATTIWMLGYKGRVTRAEARRFVVRRTGIPPRFWKPLAKGFLWHGFKAYETYHVTHRGRTLVGSMLRHRDGFHTYLVFIAAPTRSFIRFRKAYKLFGNSFVAL